MEKLTKTAQQELLGIDQNLKTEVKIPRSKKKYKIGWLKPYTTNKISAILLQNEAPKDLAESQLLDFMTKKSKVVAKISAYIILNNFWKIKFFHGIFWRWLFYIDGFDYEQLQPIILEGKKKMMDQGFWICMAVASAMMDTTRTMMKKEASQFLQELTLVTGQPSEKNTLGQ